MHWTLGPFRLCPIADVVSLSWSSHIPIAGAAGLLLRPERCGGFFLLVV